jgi:glycosyltransferase involved in cell wall biosynthesis
MNPEVAIAVPCYNQAHYLDDALGSIRAQTYPHWKAVVVDDASPDGAEIERVVQRIGDPRIRIVRHARNRGLAAARNTGFRESGLGLLTCLDADDKLEPRYLEALVRVIAADDSLDCVFPDSKLFGINDRIILFHVPRPGEIFRRQSLPGSGTLMRRRLWERLEGYDESEIMRNGREDWEFYIRAFSTGCKAAHVPEVLHLYRTTGTSMNIQCRLNDDKVAKYIYQKNRHLFASDERRAFFSFAYDKAIAASGASGLRRRALLLSLQALRFDPSFDRLKSLVRVALPSALARRLRSVRV